MRDPKFGYHYIWLAPLALVLSSASSVLNRHRESKHKRHIKQICSNPEINEISTLAGIKNND